MEDTCYVDRIVRAEHPDDPNTDFFIDMKNVVKDENGKYYLYPVFTTVDNNIYIPKDGKPVDLFRTTSEERCFTCSHHLERYIGGGRSVLFCEFLHSTFGFPLSPLRLSGFDSNRCAQVYDCDACDSVKEINVIYNGQEMIDFINKTKNFFSNGEDWERYFGFQLEYNESTDSLETVEHYFEHGGKFTNTPTSYPAIVVFDHYVELPLKWEALKLRGN